jgi:uncharacterized protein (TIGR03086 family)
MAPNMPAQPNVLEATMTETPEPTETKPTETTVATDPVTLLSAALDQTGSIIVGIRDDQRRLPTPCRSWDVTELVAHVVHDLSQFTERASGGTPDWSAPMTAVEGDPVHAFREGASGLLQAWHAAGDLSGAAEVPGMGQVAKRFPVDQQIAEMAVHAWDLAVATGQSTDLDPEVGDAALTWARTALWPQFRGAEDDGKAFGPEVDVPREAPLYDRLAGFFGRRVG